eukprot:6618895-Prymnesium_polylepis.1
MHIDLGCGAAGVWMCWFGCGNVSFSHLHFTRQLWGRALCARRSETMISLAPLLLAQYGPDPPGVPTSFKCGWRQLAFEYGTELRPDASALLTEALQLPAYCDEWNAAGLAAASQGSQGSHQQFGSS